MSGFQFTLQGSVDGEVEGEGFAHLEAWLRGAPLPVLLSYVTIGSEDFDLQAFQTRADELIESEMMVRDEDRETK